MTISTSTAWPSIAEHPREAVRRDHPDPRDLGAGAPHHGCRRPIRRRGLCRPRTRPAQRSGSDAGARRKLHALVRSGRCASDRGSAADARGHGTDEGSGFATSAVSQLRRLWTPSRRSLAWTVASRSWDSASAAPTLRARRLRPSRAGRRCVLRHRAVPRPHDGDQLPHPRPLWCSRSRAHRGPAGSPIRTWRQPASTSPTMSTLTRRTRSSMTRDCGTGPRRGRCLGRGRSRSSTSACG